MARVAVLHNTLDLQGGADAVCMHTVEALQERHRVTLFTVSSTPLETLNDLFDTDVRSVAVRNRPLAAAAIGRGVGLANRITGGRTGPALGLRSLLVGRLFARHAGAFDLAVSTANEFALSVPSVQYVHYPQFNRRRLNGDGPTLAPLDRAYARLAGVDELDPAARLVANSGWTAGVVERAYGRRPAVIYPPVDPPVSEPPAWERREPGFVALGRIAPDKNHLRLIGIVDRLRRRGHDVHLHVVGSTARAYRGYLERVADAAADREYVHLEGEMSRDRLGELLARHRYGLHGKDREHFGMAVAELVASGLVTFVPAGGGQQEIVDDPDLTYGSVPEAVETIGAALAADRRPGDVGAVAERFGTRRFRAEMRAAVADRLSGGSR